MVCFSSLAQSYLVLELWGLSTKISIYIPMSKAQMDVCGAWPLNCFGCKHELFSETHRGRNGFLYQWACSFWHCSILFSCILERKMGLVWFPHFGGGRKPHWLSGYCVAGLGAPYALWLTLPCSPESRAFIGLLSQAITPSHRGSAT